MKISDEILKNDIKGFLGIEGIKYLQEYKNNDKFYIAWGSFLGGNVGMQVRNFLINKYGSSIYEDIGYQEFEDITCELALKLLA